MGDNRIDVRSIDAPALRRGVALIVDEANLPLRGLETVFVVEYGRGLACNVKAWRRGDASEPVSCWRGSQAAGPVWCWFGGEKRGSGWY